MNDLTFVEAARVLAERVVAESGDDGERIATIVRRVLARDPDASELQKLRTTVDRMRKHYTGLRTEAVALSRQGDHDKRANLDPIEVATFTIVASTIFNLDEAMTRE